MGSQAELSLGRTRWPDAVTRTAFLPLGASPLDQAQRFQCQLGSLAKTPDGVTVVFDAEGANAAVWAEQTEAISAEL